TPSSKARIVHIWRYALTRSSRLNCTGPSSLLEVSLEMLPALGVEEVHVRQPGTDSDGSPPREIHPLVGRQAQLPAGDVADDHGFGAGGLDDLDRGRDSVAIAVESETDMLWPDAI